MILLTNDDGIDAPGIKALESIIKEPYAVVAPMKGWSGCSHQVTAYHDIDVQKIDDLHYSISGTPADCVRLGLSQLFPEITCVLSGINDGGNLGVDIHLSGTVAAVREAAIHGQTLNVAFSQYRRAGLPTDWEASALLARSCLNNIKNINSTDRGFWNINFPYIEPTAKTEPKLQRCKVSKDPLPLSYQKKDNSSYRYNGKYAERTQSPGTDVEICLSGNISVSFIEL